MVDLNRYVDLTPNQVGFLRDPARAHPAARAAFIKDGLLRLDGELTPDGCKALEIAEAYFSGQRQPEPPVIIVQNGVEIRFAPDRQRGLNAVHLKALLALARSPGLAWRWMCSTYGPDVMQKLWREDYILERPVRGAPPILDYQRAGCVGLYFPLTLRTPPYMVKKPKNWPYKPYMGLPYMARNGNFSHE